jgi:hypothetical protein
LQNAFAFLRGAVRQKQFYGVAQSSANYGVRNPSVPAGGVQNCSAGEQVAFGDSRIDHPERCSIFNRAARIAPLRLGQNFNVCQMRRYSLDSQQRCIANQIEHTLAGAL